MPLYRPRMRALLRVPVQSTLAQQERSSETVDLDLHPLRARIERNNHNQADTCSVTLDWTEAGVDPRMLNNGVLRLHVGDADNYGNLEPSRENLCFVGILKEIESSRGSDEAGTVELSCVDFTTLFLEAKPFGSLGIPDFSQRLDEAWRTVVSQTPGAGLMANKLVAEGFTEWPPLGKAVSDRFKKLAAKVPVHPKTDAWAVWQQCVGMLGLISFIHLDHCIVTTATNLYSDEDPPMLIYGQNLLSWNESRLCAQAQSDIGLTSFDPLQQRTIEAFWRPRGYKPKPGEPEVNEDKRKHFSLPGVTDSVQLLEVAKRVYDEHSRQELEGSIVTREMAVATERGKRFDLLNLRAGDSVRVHIDPRFRNALSAVTTDHDRFLFLVARGYQPGVAQLIVRNMKNIGALSSKFLVKQAAITLDAESYEVEISYINRIQVDGSAVA